MVTVTQETLGQLTIEPLEGGFSVQGPADGSAERLVLPCDPAAIQQHMRRDDRGRYRPLSGARTLPSGWRLECRDGTELAEAVDAVYPLAATHRAQSNQGTLRVVPLASVLQRQSGRYAAAAELSDPGRAAAREALCGDCVRLPVWNGQAAKSDEIPCPEPCSVLVALCREGALWELNRPQPSAIDQAIGYADFTQPGNEIRERVLLLMESGQRN